MFFLKKKKKWGGEFLEKPKTTGKTKTRALEQIETADTALRACVLSHFSYAQLLRPHGVHPARLLCPWGFPGKDTGVGCHVLLQGIFQTQGSDPRLPRWQAGSLPLVLPQKPT